VASMTMLAAIRETLLDEMARDERVVLLGEDIGVNGGVFRATDGALERFGPQRVLDTPISESTIVGASVGLSIAGLVPVAEIQFGGFTMQAYHQLVGQLARLRYRSRGRYHCPVTVRSAYGGGVRTPEHHSDSVEAPYAHAPGLSVVVPSNAADAKGLLTSAIRSDDPVVVFEHKGLFASRGPTAPEGHVVPLGQAAVVRPGDDITLVALASTVPTALAAAEALDAEGVSPEVIDLRCLVPLDIATVLASVARTSRILIVEENPYQGGWGGTVASIVADEGFESLDAPVRRIAAACVPLPFADVLEDEVIPTVSKVVEAVRRLAAY